MRPTTQTITVGDGSGRPGNCLQAAVASLLDLDLDVVPHFVEAEDWRRALVAFAAEHGYALSYRPVDDPPAFGLAFGPSPRTAMHAVVCLDGAVVWDPHPSRDGLVSVTAYVKWEKE